MERVELGGVPVEYEIVGAGDPVVVAHARPFVSWYDPLIAELAGWAVLRYRRPAPEGRPFGIADDAALCAELVRHVGIVRPHVVGHSYGGLVALELARQRVVELRSLALLEPAPAGLLEPVEAAARFGRLLDMARHDGASAAMGAFLLAVCGEDWPDVLERMVPGAVDDAMANAGGFFGVELPAVIAWSFESRSAAAIDVPVLNVHGMASDARFAAGAAVIQSWFPGAEACVIADVGHLLMAQDPAATSLRLRRFWRST